MISALRQARVLIGQKKTRRDNPGGVADKVRTLLLAGTVAPRPHAPLARQVFCMVILIEIVDGLALYGGNGKNHRGSRADLTENVKSQAIIRPKPGGS